MINDPIPTDHTLEPLTHPDQPPTMDVPKITYLDGIPPLVAPNNLQCPRCGQCIEVPEDELGRPYNITRGHPSCPHCYPNYYPE